MHRSFRIAALGAAALLLEASLASAGSNGVSLSPVRDSVVDSSALLVTTGGNWGRAINGEAFRDDPLVTYDGYQYTAWYRKDADYSIMLARRSVNGATPGAWETVDTGYNFERGLASSNVHNIISIGIAPKDGTIHLAYDMHAQALRYRVTLPGVATTNKQLWGASMFNGAESNLLGTRDLGNISYPTFVTTPTGDLKFMYRGGQSGNGGQAMSTYAGGVWSARQTVTAAGGGAYVEGSVTSNNRNAYINGLTYGPDGKLHMTWVWREQSGGGANQALNYAYSEDGGTSWKNNAGTVIHTGATNQSISIADPGIIVRPLTLKDGLYNQVGQAIDKNNGVHVLTVHRREGAEYAWSTGDDEKSPSDSGYFHYYRNPTSGQWSWTSLPTQIADENGGTIPLPIGRRGDIAADADGNIFAAVTTRSATANPDAYYPPGYLVIASATAASNYTDWEVLYRGTLLLEGEPQIDRNRLMSSGILSILMQETSSVTTYTGTNLHVFEFDVSAVPEPTFGGLVLGGASVLLRRRRSR